MVPSTADCVVTYCSREKDPSAGLLPAVDRYLSSRIQVSLEASSRLGTGFRILSGLFGLLAEDREIPEYDHILTGDQVPRHAGKIEQQLREFGVERVIFITRTLAADPGTGPYREAMSRACDAADVDYQILEIGSRDPSVEELIGLIRPLIQNNDGQEV